MNQLFKKSHFRKTVKKTWIGQSCRKNIKGGKQLFKIRTNIKFYCFLLTVARLSRSLWFATICKTRFNLHKLKIPCFVLYKAHSNIPFETARPFPSCLIKWFGCYTAQWFTSVGGYPVFYRIAHAEALKYLVSYIDIFFEFYARNVHPKKTVFSNWI